MVSKEEKSSPMVDGSIKEEKEMLSPLGESKINPSRSSIIETTPPNRLAWSSYRNNKITIMDIKTKQEIVVFDGVQISDTASSWTHVKEISNTNLLVSLHHNYGRSANMEVLEISKEGGIQKIYSLGEVSGVVGHGDVTYNTRRNLLGAIPVGGQIAYHLFSIDGGNTIQKGRVKLIRKSKWHSQYSTEEGNLTIRSSADIKHLDNAITELDFNPAGEMVATIDRYGACLISDISSGTYQFHLEMGSNDPYGRCRWSSNVSEPLVYLKYGYRQLNMMDVEKKTLILKYPVQLEEKSPISSQFYLANLMQDIFHHSKNSRLRQCVCDLQE